MYVKIPKDISKYKEKVILGLTWRQLICSALALVICIPLWYFLKNNTNISEDNIGWIIIIIAMPIFSVGWLDIHGLPVEKYIFSILKHELLYPTVRPYKTYLELEMEEKNAFKERRKGIKVQKSRRKK